MAEKVIRKVIQLVITEEEWIRDSFSDPDRLGYTVKGEVKNIGLSSVKNALVVGGIINPRNKQTYQVLTKNFKIFKAADYTILPEIKPGGSSRFEINLQFPRFQMLAFGKYFIRKLEDKLLNEDLRQRSFLLYDEKTLDEKTEGWFRDELLEYLKLSNVIWDAVFDNDKMLRLFRCKGKVKNTGIKSVQDFVIRGVLTRKSGETILLQTASDKIPISGQVLLDELDSYKSQRFTLDITLPNIDLLLDNGLSTEKLEEMRKNDDLVPKLRVRYQEDSESYSIYRNSEEAPSIIEDSSGTTEVEMEEESWALDTSSGEYYITGILKNTGTRDVENISVIAAISNVDTGEPIAWETATDRYKTRTIESVQFLKVGGEQTFALKVILPTGKKLAKNSWTIASIEEGIEKGTLDRKVHIFYKKEDIVEESKKRIFLGNSYFQLKNYRGCLQEYADGLRLVPDDLLLFFNSALCYYKMGAFENAIEYCNKTLELDERFKKAFYLLGLIYQSQNKQDLAMKAYNNALKFDKKDINSLYNKGCLLIGQGNMKAGLSVFREAVEIDSNGLVSNIAHDQDMRVHMKNDDFKEFLASARKKV